MKIPESEADWRLSTVARVKGDQFVLGGPVKDGTLVWLTSVTEAGKGGKVSFPTPSPAALALSIAIEAARAAGALLRQVEFEPGDGGSKSVTTKSLPLLYAYFEQAMASAVFSYQSIEAYSNQIIAARATGPIEIARRSGKVSLAPSDLERTLSTDEKLTVVLPLLLKARSPKGKAVWGAYRSLKDVRDSTVHLKSADQYVRGRPDRDSVYYRLLNRQAASFPRAATGLIRHFCDQAPERWLEAAEARLGKLAPRGSA